MTLPQLDRFCTCKPGGIECEGCRINRERRAVQGQAAESYRQANPLGGPAKVFDAIAEAIRAGDPVDQAMREFGVCWQAAPEARMLTEQELSPITPHCMPDSPLARSFEAIQRRFCEVNGISLSGAKAGRLG